MSSRKRNEYDHFKSIPLWYDKGLLTLVIGSKVMLNIEKHEAQITPEIKESFYGLLFGEIRKSDVIIQESIQSGNELNTGSMRNNLSSYTIQKYQLMGYYTYGIIPNEKDVEILHSASEQLQRSLFLIKYDCCEAAKKVAIFECVPHWHAGNGKQFLILIQTSSNPFLSSEDDYASYEDKKNLIKYLFPGKDSIFIRPELDPNEDQKLRRKERPIPAVSNLTKKKKKEFMETLKKYCKQEEAYNEVTVLSKVCEKTNIEGVYVFHIPIDDKKDRKQCNLFLSYNVKESFCSSSLTIEGAQKNAADCAIDFLLEELEK